jgi:hypothetical protein
MQRQKEFVSKSEGKISLVFYKEMKQRWWKETSLNCCYRKERTGTRRGEEGLEKRKALENDSKREDAPYFMDRKMRSVCY